MTTFSGYLRVMPRGGEAGVLRGSDAETHSRLGERLYKAQAVSRACGIALRS